MLCAHMDEVGLIVKGITDEGYLKFGCVGGIDRRVLPGRRVSVGPGKRPGVVGLKAYHLVDKEEEKKVPKVEDMYIDVGAGDRAEAEAFVFLGDVCAFVSPPEDFGDGFLKAKAIDDRFGCACLLRRLRDKRPAADTWTVFTAQEEVGTRGAFGAAFGLAPRAAVIVEATTAADRPDLPGHKQVCRPGAGVVIPTADRGAFYSPRLRRIAIEQAERLGIPWQDKEFVSGGTDAAAIQTSRGGVETLGLAIATRYLHSPATLACTADFEHAYRVFDAVADVLDREGEKHA
jgi:endoglucanase